MTKPVLNILFSLILSLYSFYHPIHVTVVNIEPDAKRGVFDVSFKIFTDDLELAIIQQTKTNIGLTKNLPIQNIEHYLKKFICSHFKLIINGKEIAYNKINFVKYKIVEDATWIYFEYKITSKIKTLEIYNNLLNNLYPDMTNLVIINWGNKENGYTFVKNNTRIKIS